MKKTVFLTVLLAGSVFVFGAEPADIGACSARPAPEWLTQGVIYQIWLRAFTPEYGTEADLKAFIAEAHRLGLRVAMDLVYFHCGPTTVLQQRPGFIKKDASGALALGPWGFPMPDFDNPACETILSRTCSIGCKTAALTDSGEMCRIWCRLISGRRHGKGWRRSSLMS